jgi:hypothetical protein
MILGTILTIRRAAMLLLAAAVTCFAVPLEAAETWKSGAAAVTITPERFMWMAGYAARTRPAEGKSTELWAKALVLEDGERNRGVIVTLDLIGLDRALSASICEKLGDRHGLKREQIALCTSHTHSGPVVARNLRPMHYYLLDDTQKELVDAYAHRLEEKVVEVVGQAIEHLAPAELTWGSGTATFAANRRNNAEGEIERLRAENKVVGPSDHDVPVLATHNEKGELTAVLFGYACHGTVLDGYEWSGDYAGHAQIGVEEAHPGCVALFWAGCGGDQNPMPRRTVDLAKRHGRELTDAVNAVLKADMKPIEGTLTTAYTEVAIPFAKLPDRDQLVADSESDNVYVAARAKVLLSEINAGRPLSATYPYPIACWKLGNQVQFVALGGEVVVDYALRLKEELRGGATWVAGYSNDVMAYIPSKRVLTEGGYEGGGAMVYYGLPTAWAPEVEETIVRGVHEQLGSGN